jgi:hypothetical protein
MSLNIDTKALLNYSPVDVNGSFLSDQKVDTSESLRAAYSQALSQAQQGSRVGTPSILSPDVPQVTVKPGDNMTSLVKNHLLSKGFVPNPSDLKKMVFDVARQNGISNPNLIFPGQRLQMASLEASLLEGSFQADNKKTPVNLTKEMVNGASEGASPAQSLSAASSEVDLGLSDGEQALGKSEPTLSSAKTPREHAKSHEIASTNTPLAASNATEVSSAQTTPASAAQSQSPSPSLSVAPTNISTQQLLEQRSAVSKMAMSVMSSALNPNNMSANNKGALGLGALDTSNSTLPGVGNLPPALQAKFNAMNSLNGLKPQSGSAMNPVMPNFVASDPNDPNNALTAASQIQLMTRLNGSAYPILQKTLDRAVDKGFIPPQDKQAVHDKILNLARQFKFAPDDFAKVTLMESDGMNPKSTNNRCHGIIQFCDGPDRGAASAGFANNPKAILSQSVLQQLDMVGKYFDQTGLKNAGPTHLDDLYLTVLTPSAKSETRTDVGLNIAGPQAAHLHVNKDNRAPITRDSIVKGLHQNALDKLGLDDKSIKDAMRTGQPTQVVSKNASASSVVSAAVASTIDGRGNLIKPNLQASSAFNNAPATQVASLESQLQNNIRRSQALRVNAYLSNSLMGGANGAQK